MSRFNLSAWAIRHQALVLFFILVLAAAGATSYFKLGRNEDPSFTIKVMVVTAIWPGATADEMNRQVADPIERKLQTLPWLDYVKTYTRPSFTALQVVLKDATPPSAVGELWYQVRKKIGDIKGDLPTGVIGPSFNDEYSDVYVAVFTLTAPDADMAALVDAAERVRLGFLRVPNVDKVELLGEQARKIFVNVSNAKLAQLGLGPQAIFDALARQNAVIPAGSIDTASERVTFRVTGALQGADAVRAVPVAAGGRSFRLGDIAEVTTGLEDPPSFAVRKDRERALALAVAMKKGANVLTLGKHLATAAATLRAELPVGFELAQVTNQAKVVDEAISEFLFKFVVAVSIVLIVSFVSLGLRTGVIVALAVPLTLAGTFTAMEVFGIDLQRVSLGSLILSLGLLVDDAIIAIEMMVVKIEQGWDRPRAATFAWESTAFPMLFGTLVTAAGFLPVGLAASSTGEYAGGVFWVVTIALCISWVVAVVFTPFLGLHLLPKSLETKAQGHGGDPHAIYRTPIFERLRATVRWSMRHKVLVVAGTVALLVGAGVGHASSCRSSSSRPRRAPSCWSSCAGRRAPPSRSPISEAKKLEAELAGDPDLDYFTTYVGAGPPRFFLAYSPALPNPNYAHWCWCRPRSEIGARAPASQALGACRHVRGPGEDARLLARTRSAGGLSGAVPRQRAGHRRHPQGRGRSQDNRTQRPAHPRCRTRLGRARQERRTEDRPGAGASARAELAGSGAIAADAAVGLRDDAGPRRHAPGRRGGAGAAEPSGCSSTGWRIWWSRRAMAAPFRSARWRASSMVRRTRSSGNATARSC